MRSLVILCFLGIVLTQNMEDCAIMTEAKCVQSNLCNYRPPVCRIGVSKCEGIPVNICNAADACKWELGAGTCRNTQCMFALNAQECRKNNVYSLDCQWIEKDMRCISTNTCVSMPDAETCRQLSNQGCQWSGSNCKPNDPCEGKSPTKCMSDGAAYKCWTTPGDCYGDAVGNLDRKIKEGASYEVASGETNILSHNMSR